MLSLIGSIVVLWAIVVGLGYVITFLFVILYGIGYGSRQLIKHLVPSTGDKYDDKDDDKYRVHNVHHGVKYNKYNQEIKTP